MTRIFNTANATHSHTIPYISLLFNVSWPVHTVHLFVLSARATYTAHRNFLHFTILTSPGVSINHTIIRRVISWIDQKLRFYAFGRANDKSLFSLFFFLHSFLQFSFPKVDVVDWNKMNMRLTCCKTWVNLLQALSLKPWSSDQKISVCNPFRKHKLCRRFAAD